MYRGRRRYRHHQRHRRRDRRRLHRHRPSPRSDHRGATNLARRTRTVARLVQPDPPNTTAQKFCIRPRSKMAIQRVVRTTNGRSRWSSEIQGCMRPSGHPLIMPGRIHGMLGWSGIVVSVTSTASGPWYVRRWARTDSRRSTRRGCKRIASPTAEICRTAVDLRPGCAAGRGRSERRRLRSPQHPTAAVLELLRDWPRTTQAHQLLCRGRPGGEISGNEPSSGSGWVR